MHHDLVVRAPLRRLLAVALVALVALTALAVNSSASSPAGVETGTVTLSGAQMLALASKAPWDTRAIEAPGFTVSSLPIGSDGNRHLGRWIFSPAGEAIIPAGATAFSPDGQFASPAAASDCPDNYTCAWESSGFSGTQRSYYTTGDHYPGDPPMGSWYNRRNYRSKWYNQYGDCRLMTPGAQNSAVGAGQDLYDIWLSTSLTTNC